MNARKPHSVNAGFVCELKARLGGHIVIYDREAGCEIDADWRWIVMHEPSSLHVAVGSQRLARDIMKGVARSKTLNEALRYADILPRRGSNACEADNDGAVDGVTPARAALLERWWNATDPEEEKALLRELFGLKGGAS